MNIDEADEIKSLHSELESLKTRMTQIYTRLAIVDKTKPVIFTNQEKQKEQLFCVYSKCPVCYEKLARGGYFQCKHCICITCYSKLNRSCCPLCRSI